jgi:hypothetical protein
LTFLIYLQIWVFNIVYFLIIFPRK